MKVLEANAGLMTNFEVFKLLEERGAAHADLAGSGSAVALSECQVYEYLSGTPAATQTQEAIGAFVKACEKFSLMKAEILQAINLRPSSAVEVHLIVEDCDERLSEEAVESFLETVEQYLPPPPERPEPAEGDEEGGEGETEAEAQE